MKTIRMFQSRVFAVVIRSIVLVILIEIGLFVWQNYKPRESRIPVIPTVAEILLTSPSVYEYVTGNIERIILYQDAEGAINLVKKGFEQGAVNMYECHTLAHLIGHHAVQHNHFNHIGMHVTAENVNFCGGGFMHGIEEGLASQADPNFREKLYRFCKSALPVATAYRGCYHGAGHAFMRKSDDFKKAFVLCDSLITDQRVTATHCYRGVLSEYIDKLQESGKDNTFLLDFCAYLPQQFHEICGFELNGLSVKPDSSPLEIEQAFRDCTQEKYDVDIQSACMQSVSWVATGNILAKQDEIIPPNFIFTLSPELRQAYIFGTTAIIRRTIENGAHKNWQSFCASFPAVNDRSSCKESMGINNRR